MLTSSLPRLTFPDSIGPTFHQRLLRWYDRHARDLPWRARPGEKRRDPYPVWVSEIMLQQTRVAAVMAHYREFLRRFPTVEKLAAAREPSVLAAWSGLGYYRRARMLHAAAKVVVRELGGEFPTTAEGWRALPGIGRYTAAAIASIAFDEPVAVVDGNVERVLQRVAGKRLGADELWRAAQGLLENAPHDRASSDHASSDRECPGDFNQAMMELGATVCTPRAPSCLACPVVELCAARGELAGAVKTARQKKREIHYALDYRTGGREGSVFLVRRPGDARLMAGMWELPEIPAGAKARFNGAGEVAALKALRHPKTRRGERDEFCFALKHSITVTDYTVRVWRRVAPDKGAGQWIAIRRLEKLAITGLARKILRRAGLLQGAGGIFVDARVS